MSGAVRVHAAELAVQTPGRGFTDVTSQVQAVVRASAITTGQCTIFLQHTSASLLITENADPDVRRDLQAWFARLVKDGDPLFHHDAEGPDDMSAHVRAALTQTSLVVPVLRGRCALGTWQGLYVWEHRFDAHQRRLVVTVLGD